MKIAPPVQEAIPNAPAPAHLRVPSGERDAIVRAAASDFAASIA
jgi:hypothetical protein